MSALAHPVPSFSTTPTGPSRGGARRRRHLALVPDATQQTLADVLFLPAPAVPTAVPVSRPEVAVRPLAERPARRSVAAERAPDRSAAPLRLTVRGRRVLVGLVLALAAVVGAIGGTAVSATTAAPTGTVDVTVQPGQTLWAVAVAAAPAGADVRDVVDQIRVENGLVGSTVVAGQVLSVPDRG